VLGVLFMHEVHTVRGRAEDDFEAAFRDGWMPLLAEGDDARLLWYANQAHGSGPAYTVITVTAVRDGASWEQLTLRVQKGDLQGWMRNLDELRHEVDAKLLMALPWSPLQEVRFDEVPVDGREHEMTLYMEDTMWPYEDKFEEYIVRSGDVYARSLEHPSSMLKMHAAFQPALGSHGSAARSAAQSYPGRVPRPWHLDARRPGPARPVDQPVTADRRVVPPLLGRG
jgi:hypothetical protein